MYLQDNKPKHKISVSRFTNGGGGQGPNRSKIFLILGLASLYFLNRRFI